MFLQAVLDKVYPKASMTEGTNKHGGARAGSLNSPRPTITASTLLADGQSSRPCTGLLQTSSSSIGRAAESLAPGPPQKDFFWPHAGGGAVQGQGGATSIQSLTQTINVD